MSSDAKALLMRTRASGLLRSPLLFDVLHTLEHEMRQAVKNRTVSIADWTAWLKKGETHRSAFVQALFLIVAAGGMSADDVHRLRTEMQSVTPSRQRAPRLIHTPAERQTRGLL